MKFWELTSVFRDEEAILEKVLKESIWSKYNNWNKDMSRIVAIQDRSILDAETPEELCRKCFSHSKKLYFIEGGNLFRLTEQIRPKGKTKIYSALEVFEMFKGKYIEDVHEYSSVKIAVES